MKQNDWIVAGINNPNFDNNDFKDIGLNLENTQILSVEDYLKTDFIKDNPNFQDQSGVFQETKFRDYYNSRINQFKDFTEDTNYQALQFDLFDSRNQGNGRVKNPNLKVYSVSNPLHTTKGTAGVTDIGLTGLTAKEQAQKNKVFDPETGKFEDYSPNDQALFKNPLNYLKSLFTDPLVYAQYDEDGVHIDPITGQQVEHKKGDFKLNPDGEYYTEKLNNRSPNGKTFVSSFDTITVDESAINKYDFFDADSADKNILESIASAAATVAPLFLGPEVSAIYSAALVTRELSKALPLLGSFVDMFIGTNLQENSLFNALSGKAQQLTGGTSEYSTQNQLTFENISKIVSDVATQWGQQKAIAKGINLIKNNTKKLQAAAYENAGKKFIEQSTSQRLAAMISGDKKAVDAFYKNTGLNSLEDSALAELLNSGKWTETALGKAAMASEMKLIEPILEKQAKIGANASLAYMALISNTDVYQDMIEAGATKKEAALVALGSTLGMYKVDKTGIGELFFDDLTAVHTKQVRSLLKNELASWQQTLNATINNPNIKGPNKLLNLIGTGRQIGSKVLSNYWDDIRFHTTGFLGKSVGEGLEEVSEELVADIFKQLYEIGGAFGVFSQKDVGAWKDFGTRAGMSFLGGALGGGIFYGAGVVNGQYPLNINNSDLLYLVRNGRTQEIRDQINTWKEQGKFGSTELSATKYHEDDNGNKTYLTADTKEDSQNDFIANQILYSVDQVDAIINANQLNLTEDQLFDQMVLSEVRYQDLRDWLQDESYSYGYQQEFQHIVEDLVTAQTELNTASQTKSGTISDTSAITDPERRNLEGTVEGEQRKASLAELQKKVDDLKQKRDLFLSGDNSLKYTRKMLFALDSRLSSKFADVTFNQYVFNNHHKNVEQLTETELQTYLQEYSKYRDNEKRQKLDEEFEKFLKLEPLLTKPIQDLEENSKAFKSYYSSLPQLQEILDIKPAQLTDTLEGDTPEQIEVIKNAVKQYEEVIKNKKKEDYTPEDIEIINILNNRGQQLDEHNTKVVQDKYQKINEWIAEVGGKIDPITFRNLWRSLNINKVKTKNLILEESLKQINENIDRLSELSDNSQFISLVKEKLNSLTKNNKDEILSDLYSYIEEDIKSNIKSHEFWIDSFRGEESHGELDYTPENYFIELKEALENEIEQNKAEILDGTITEEDENRAIEQYIKQYIQNNSVETLVNNPEYIDYIYNLIVGNIGYDGEKRDEDIENETQETAQEAKEFIGKIINETANSINSNIHLKAYDQIKAASTKINPFINFITSALTALGEENSAKIEDILQQVFDSMENLEDQGDFRLTPEQIGLFNKTKDILELIEGYLYAASSSATLLTPYGHNKTINDFFNNHKDAISKFKELPELSDQTYSLYLSEFDKYKEQLDAFIQKSNQNAINKTRKFKIADEKFVEARKQFYETNKDAFVITLSDGKTYNLLDGVEKLTPGSNPNEKTIYINKVEQLLYDNIQQLLANGITFRQILDAGVLKKLIVNPSGTTDVEEQLSAPLDENITYDSLTNYDKVIYFLTVASLGVSDWNQFNLAQVKKYPDIIPLTIQQYIARIAVAKYNKPEIFNEGLKYLSDEHLINDRINRLDNITFISGIAGAGKSSICGKWVVDWASQHGVNQEDIWLSAPEELQIANLKRNVVLGNSISKSDLFKKLFNLDLVEGHLDLKDSLSRDDGGNTIKQVKLDAYKTTTTKLPKLLVIDEGTYFSNEEYQLLNNLGINIVVLGDPNQNGYQKIGGNIDREFCFVTRTPKLEISLRDNNLQNQDNQIATSNLLSELSAVKEKTPEAISKSQDFIKAMGKLQYRVYLGEDINGTLITKGLDSDTLKLIPKNINGNPVSIGYIGSPDSKNYKKLVEAGFSPEVFGDVSKVQGQEFDYIFVDNQLSLIAPSKNIEVHAFNYFVELRKIYTLMSRGKIGSIFIDPNGIMQSLVGKNTIDQFKATAPSLKEAAETFRGPFLELLDVLVREVVPKEIVVPKKEKTKPSETPKKEVAPEGPSEEAPGPSEEVGTEDLKGDEEDFEEEPAVFNPVSEEVEFPDEIANDMEQTTIHLNDVPVYSKFSLVGVPVKVETVKNEQGKEIQVQSWFQPTGTKRDIGIFMSSLIERRENPEGNLDITLPLYKNNPERVYTDRTNLITSLMQLKSALLFKTPYSELPLSITSRFSEKDLESVKFKIEIRKKTDQDFTVGGMQETVGINDVLINVVAEIKRESTGETVLVTMGALANPQTNIDQAATYISSLNKSIDRLDRFLKQQKEKGDLTSELETAINDRIQLLQTRIHNNDAINTKYQTDINNLIELFKKNGEQPMFYDVQVYNSRVTSTERPRTASMLQFDIFKKENQGKMIVSKPYIVAGNLPGVSDSMKGKAVVFVSAESSNKGMTSETLVTNYLEQRAAIVDSNQVDSSKNESNSPKVRMLVLSNRAYDLDTLLHRENPKDTPFEWGVIGRKMLVSTWNFRANLLNFITQYENFDFQVPEGQNKDSYIEKVALASSLIYEANTNNKPELLEQLPKEVIDADNNLTKEAKIVERNIQKFNNSLATEVKDFRLGGAINGTQYISKLTNISEGNKFYNTEKGPIYGIYLGINRARKFSNLLDALFSTMNPVLTLKDSSGEDLDPTFIVSGKDKSSNNINNYDKALSGKITFEDGTSIEFGGRQQYAAFSATLLKILRKVWYSQNLKEQIEQEIEGTPEKDNGVNVKLEVGGTEETHKLDMFNIIGNLDTEEPDYSFSDMFKLIIHGTTDNITENPNTPKAYSAYFKKGIMMHPLKKPHSGIEYGTFGLSFFEAENPDSMFLIDRVPTFPVFRISTSDLETFSKEGPTVETDSWKDELRNKIPDQFKDELESLLEYESTEQEIRESLHKSIQNIIHNELSIIFNSYTKIQGNTIIGCDQDFNTITLNQYLEQKGISPQSEYTLTEKEIILDNSQNKKVISYNNIDKRIEIKTFQSDAEDNDQSKKEGLKTAILQIQQYIDNEDALKFFETLDQFQDYDSLKNAYLSWNQKFFDYLIDLNEEIDELEGLMSNIETQCKR